MIPLYLFDYWVGLKIVQLMNLEYLENPVWMERINIFLQTRCHFPELSVWAFLIGGNVVGIIAGLLVYPVSLYGIKKFLKRYRHKDS